MERSLQVAHCLIDLVEFCFFAGELGFLPLEVLLQLCHFLLLFIDAGLAGLLQLELILKPLELFVALLQL